MTLTQATLPTIATLSDLVGRVGAGDHDAFCALHVALAPMVLVAVEATLWDPGQATAVSRATFVEVWWLSRHAGRHHRDIADVPAWIVAIAVRRAKERRRTLDLAIGSPFLTAVGTGHDEHTSRQLAAMLG